MEKIEKTDEEKGNVINLQNSNDELVSSLGNVPPDQSTIDQTTIQNRYYGTGRGANKLTNCKTFLGNWQKLMASVTDADARFIHSAGLFLLSTFAIWFRIITLSNVSFRSGFEDYGKELALWFLNFGKSRITRKSTVVGKVEDIIVELLESTLLPNEFTPESFITEASISGHESGGRTHVTWVNDEVLPTFERMEKSGGYMTGTDSIMSKTYDGRDYTRRTLKRGNEKVKHPYFTIFACSTESLPLLFDEGSFRQGFLNRPIFQYIRKASWRPEQNRGLSADEKQLLAECKEFLKALAESNPIALSFSADAKRTFDEYDKEIMEKIDSENLDIREGYIGNLPNLLQRLSALYCIDRHPIQEIAACKTALVIQKEDVEDALNYINDVVLDGLEAVIKLLSLKSVKPKEILTDDRLYALVKGYLKDSKVGAKNEIYENAMREKELFTKLNIDWNRFLRLLQDMIKREEIVLYGSVEMKGTGRRPTVIQLKS